MTAVRHSSAKFERKREDILDAAANQINVLGVKGMTLSDIARQVGLNTTSVTYYFRRKEQLAYAVFERSLSRLEVQIAAAGEAGSPRARIDHLIERTFARMADLREGRERPNAVLSDIRALEAPLRRELGVRYASILGQVAAFFEPRGSHGAALSEMRAHVVLENIFWVPAWIGRYSSSDFERLSDRFREILANGIVRDPGVWRQAPLKPEGDGEAATVADEFIRAATILINQRGYRGASVDAIAAELNVTKGSFYHHLTGKDDLVLACFELSYARVSEVQSAAMAHAGSHAQRLGIAVATLLDIQLTGQFPLLRTTALQALPAPLRGEVVDRSNRMARRFAGMMIDGITDGTIAPIDPLVASQVVMAALNSAAELRRWAQAMGRDEAVAAYAATLGTGLFEK